MDQLVIIGLGSNLGNRINHLKKGLETLSGEMELCLNSSLYESHSKGFKSEIKFLNQVVLFKTSKTIHEIFKITQLTELEHRRKRKSNGFEDRTLDIDILFYNDQIIRDEFLVIPHPGITQRLFVLEPMLEILPDFRHPGNDKSIIDLYSICEDDNQVTPFLP